MKFLIIFLLLMPFLGSCSLGDTGENLIVDNNASLIEQDIGDISISTPSTWKKISLSTLPIPKTGEIVFASASSEQRQGYLNNIVILKSKNALEESSESLMKHNVNFLDMSLESFDLKKEEKIVFNDTKTGILLTFDGKYNTQTPIITYLQTARKCGGFSYYITLSLAEKLPDYDRYAAILKTFFCKK